MLFSVPTSSSPAVFVVLAAAALPLSLLSAQELRVPGEDLP